MISQKTVKVSLTGEELRQKELRRQALTMLRQNKSAFRISKSRQAKTAMSMQNRTLDVNTTQDSWVKKVSLSRLLVKEISPKSLRSRNYKKAKYDTMINVHAPFESLSRNLSTITSGQGNIGESHYLSRFESFNKNRYQQRTREAKNKLENLRMQIDSDMGKVIAKAKARKRYHGSDGANSVL